MKVLKYFFCLQIIFFFVCCNLLKENSTYELNNGRYKSTLTGKPKDFWVLFNDTLLTLYPFQNKKEVNKNEPLQFLFNESVKLGSPAFLILSKTSFDVDVLTIPFKYRPSKKGFPNQLNTNFSGAVYAGLRKDKYRFYFKKNPLGEPKRELKHFGIGLGFFSGLGSTAINPWTTQNMIQLEYDGFIFMNGGAGIVAVNRLTFGLGIGLDILLDKNKSYWIYQHTPWIGLTVGLNLN